MHFTLDKQDKYVVVQLCEEKLNTLIAAELKSELLLLNTQGYNNIIVDLTQSKYCDSSGLSAILVGNRLCRNANGFFGICGLNEPVLKLVQISQLDKVLNITPTAAEAIELIQSTDAERVSENIKNN
jgi:anti-sigma B factor antagonist